MDSRRPSIPRDTRVLLAVVVISVSVLWVLARLRFPDRAQTPNPVAPVLAQLAPPSAFEDITASVAQTAPRIQSWLASVERPRSAAPGAQPRPPYLAALRFRDDLAMTLLPDEPSVRTDLSPSGTVAGELARDPVSRLAVVRLPAQDVPALSMWSPRRTEYPRFLFAADVSPQGTSLRPVFVGALYWTVSARWATSIWALPGPVGLLPGTFVFTAEGQLVGVAAEQDGRPAIVPGERLVEIASRLAQRGTTGAATIGVQVQPFTPPLSAALGANSGLVVAWVDANGPAAGQLAPTDVIERVDDRPLTTMEQWEAREASLTDGESVTLTARRNGEVRHLTLTARSVTAASATRPLGLTARAVRGAGSEVMRVDPDSAAMRAGLLPGDLITLAGDTNAPTPSQVSRAFAAAGDRATVAAVTRGITHFIVTLDKRP
jgi:hypothetical protein